VVRVEWLEQPTLDDLAPAAALLTEWQREVLGDDEPPMPPEQLVEEVVETPPHREGSILIALDDGDLVGVATLLCDDLQGRQQEAETQALVVAADHRGRGIGRRLLETVAQRCRERGRDRLVGYSPLTDRASTAFAERLRAERGIVDQQNRAAVEDIDRDLLERWVARASERAAAYSLVRFDGVCPDDLLVPLTTISLSMNTAPRRESREDIVPSPEQIRERQEAMRKNGQEFWTVAARHDASGELAGFTELGFPPPGRATPASTPRIAPAVWVGGSRRSTRCGCSTRSPQSPTSRRGTPMSTPRCCRSTGRWASGPWRGIRSGSCCSDGCQ
jgi:GNAT superfamily N-acetyltransferase